MNYNGFDNKKSLAMTRDHSLKHHDKAKGQLSLISLNDAVLLHIFSKLNWVDCIHLGATCMRMQRVNYWLYKKQDVFDLDEYRMKGQIPLEYVLLTVGQHIHILSTTFGVIDDVIFEKCINVKSLRIWPRFERNYDLTPEDACKINSWIRKIHLESVWYIHNRQFYDLCDGVTNLKELQLWRREAMNVSIFLERNVRVKRLSIDIENFNFRKLKKLKNLRCLHVTTNRISNLQALIEFGKLDRLTELSVTRTFSYWNNFEEINHLEKLNFFLKSLAENTKLNKLHIFHHMKIEGTCNIFKTLKLFNLTTLSLHCKFRSAEFRKFILKYPARRLKHLKLVRCYKESVKMLIENWRNLKTICMVPFGDECDEIFLNEILKISNNRPPLSLYFHGEFIKAVEFYFNLQKYKIFMVKPQRCACTKLFKFDLQMDTFCGCSEIF